MLEILQLIGKTRLCMLTSDTINAFIRHEHHTYQVLFDWVR